MPTDVAPPEEATTPPDDVAPTALTAGDSSSSPQPESTMQQANVKKERIQSTSR